MQKQHYGMPASGAGAPPSYQQQPANNNPWQAEKGQSSLPGQMPYDQNAPGQPYGYQPQHGGAPSYAPQQQQQPYYQPQQQQQPAYYNAPQQDQSYAVPPQGMYPPSSPSGMHSEKFKPTSGFPDVWATLLFLANLLGFLVFAGLKAIPAYVRVIQEKTEDDTQPLTSGESEAWRFVGYSVALSVVIAAVLTTIMSIFMRKFTKTFITAALIISVIMNFVAAIIMFYFGSIIAGIVVLFFALLYVWCAFSWRSRIPFATIMLETVIDVSKRFSGTIFTSIIALVIQALWSIFWAVSLIGVVHLYDPDTQKGALGGVVFWSLFTFYWTTQVIKNTQHVTLSGVYATFYFLYNTAQMPTNPTSGAASRALGKSFGPICFGSLIVAIVQTLRALANQAKNDRDNNGFVQILACFAACILSMLEGLIEYFNKYAYTQVAIYGKGFVQAAKDTWKLVKSHGIDALINDNLIDNVLGVAGLLIGVLTGACAYGYVYSSTKTLVDTTSYAWVGAVAGLFIGTTFQMVLNEVIVSGVATTFVCLAEDPAALQRTKPALYQAIAQTYDGIFSARV